MASRPADLLGRLGAVHDAITRFGYYCAGLCLIVIVFAYVDEVIRRYLLGSPTTWATSLVAYCLCYIVFLSMPELTRARAHIVIGIVLDLLPARYATYLQNTVLIIAAIICFVAGTFCFSATWSQYVQGISTVNDWSQPKWAVSILLPYGFYSTALYFLRWAFSGGSYVASEENVL